MAESGKPNIIMIMADDVGIWNISAYHRGMMGGSTPNIDRFAREGALFTDYYGQHRSALKRRCKHCRKEAGRTDLRAAPGHDASDHPSCVRDG
jgi:hypothetical protein